MICDGTAIYIPKKQIKKDSRVERVLEMPQDVIDATTQFMLNHKISVAQKVNIGALKQNVTYNSMEKQLKKSKLFLTQNSSEKSDAYKEFLSLFSYHDLRSSKLSHLYDQGVCINDIQEFVKHSDSKCTKVYLKSLAKKKMNLNGQVIHAICSNA